MIASLRRAATRLGLVLYAAVLAACGDSATEPPDSYLGRFEELWGRFDGTYPYFVHKAIDWSTTRAAFLPRAQMAASQAELVSLITEMLSTLHDVHIWLLRPDGTTMATLRELPQVTLVGDTTGGGSGNPELRPLGDGWQYSCPGGMRPPWTAS